MTLRLLLTACLLTACGPSIEDLDLDTDDEDPTPTDTDKTTTPTDTDTVTFDGPFSGPDANGVTRVRIDASDAEAWHYLDLDAGTVVDEDGAWTFAFRRFEGKLNGGVSGTAGVEIVLDPATFPDAETPPSAGWTTDLADSDDDGNPELALSWYDYDFTTHTLSPKAGTWYVRTAAGAVLAVQFLDYYDDAGTPGFPSFKYKLVTPSEGAPADRPLSVDASAPDLWVYVDLDASALVPAPDDPSSDLGWDLALQRATVRLCGGVNGAGEGAAYTFPDGTTWDEASEVPAEGWIEDAAPPSPYQDGTALATWFDYNPSTHVVSASGRVHAVRDADGDTWKLTVLSWDDGQFELQIAPLVAQ